MSYYDNIINLLTENGISLGDENGKARKIGVLKYLVSVDQDEDFIQINVQMKGESEEVFGQQKRLSTNELQFSYSPETLIETACETIFGDLFEAMIRAHSITWRDLPNWFSLSASRIR